MKATSHIFATMRGRVNGIVYTANQFANLIGRQYVIPTNPNSPFQVNARNALQAAVATWTGFDVDKHQLWNDYAVTTGWTKGGRLLFIRTFAFIQYLINRGLQAAPIISEPPSIFFDPLFTVEETALSGAPGIRGVAFKIGNIQPVSQRMFAQPSVEFGTSRYFWKGPWDTALSSITVVAAGNSAQLEFVDPNWTPGNRVFVRMRPFARLAAPNSGEVVGTDLIFSQIVQQTV